MVRQARHDKILDSEDIFSWALWTRKWWKRGRQKQLPLWKEILGMWNLRAISLVQGKHKSEIMQLGCGVSFSNKISTGWCEETCAQFYRRQLVKIVTSFWYSCRLFTWKLKWDNLNLEHGTSLSVCHKANMHSNIKSRCPVPN